MHFIFVEGTEVERFTVSILAGAVSRSYVIRLAEDDILECDHALSVVMVSTSACEVVIGTLNTIEITVFDTYGKNHSCSQSL